MRLISNSVDYHSSLLNISLGKKHPSIVIPFVGFHPQNFAFDKCENVMRNWESMKIELESLLGSARGIGEIGLDQGYSSFEYQLRIFQEQLELAEKYPKNPISIHSRGSLVEIVQILSGFRLRNYILFHWFAGSIQNLTDVQSRGYFCSFGPAILRSKRYATLVQNSNDDLLLAETDSPLSLSSFPAKLISPTAITSVIFKMAQIRRVSLESMQNSIEKNVKAFLGEQTS